MDTPLTDINSADVLTPSIQVFGDSFHKHFQEVSKYQQMMVDAFRLPDRIYDLEKEREIIWKRSGKYFNASLLVTEIDRKTAKVFSISR